MKSIKMFERDRIEGNAHDQDGHKIERDFKIKLEKDAKVEQDPSRTA